MTFSTVITHGERYWNLVGKDRDAAEHPTVHRVTPPPPLKELFGPNVSSADVEKPCSRLMEVSLSSLY